MRGRHRSSMAPAVLHSTKRPSAPHAPLPRCRTRFVSPLVGGAPPVLGRGIQVFAPGTPPRYRAPAARRSQTPFLRQRLAEFVDALRDRAVTPHIAVDGHVRKTGKPRATRIDRRTTRHPGYATSQRLRKRIEEGFGWIKTTGGLAKTRHRGRDRVGWMFSHTAAAYSLVRLPKLLAEAPT